MAFRGPKVWLWRWRRNPLRRRADAVEAWVLLGAWLLTVLAGFLAGVAAFRSVEHELARERHEWRQVVARLTDRAPGTAASVRNPDAPRVWAQVRWRGPDGSPHTGQVRVRPGSAAGTPVTLWTDAHGRLVTRPATVSEARLRALLVGGLVGVTAASLPYAAGRFARVRLERRRLRRWDMEWARFGPLWGRKTG
ncbi:hypothetical protein ACFOOM_12775 [Streptomyces echinoruber]|uniref:Integral membrane protein n=1 Tax=Streptomyces echinoruber TaxID=68898 RepID=A0A918VI47_9ACTN|nr:hypothetical protein [Streptomyces echinoruber]GHA00675.1 hypothetical protein GCM10010389_44800 [Streptomyces echinoruber]